jgi:4-amino-4-deoxy-L-arabinose transferase-like glycosyltransferase
LVKFGSDAVPERRYETTVAVAIFVLVGVRLACAAFTPLSFDESLYWIWSKHIAGGYYDHPPMNPILIRLGTTLFGNTELGVRVFGVLLALPASFAVWRAGAILFEDERVGATAALFFNLTLVMAVGSVLATPDNPVVIATTFLLLALTKLQQTGRGAWWLAIGVAFGIGMFSKYTTIFFAPSILIWLLLVPEQRRWLLTAWPWIAGVIALAIFSPTLIWNAQHRWASVLYQYNRLVVHDWSLRYLGEFIAAQIGMATPFVFVLGAMGLAALLRGRGGSFSARVLINAMFWPILLYFVWHTFHGRVEGNWPEPIFVPFVIAAGVAVERIKWASGPQSRGCHSGSPCRSDLGLPPSFMFRACSELHRSAWKIRPLRNSAPAGRSSARKWTKCESGWVRRSSWSTIMASRAGCPFTFPRMRPWSRSICACAM